MARALWRRRSPNDSPRPGGRRWTGRLRRGRLAAARGVLRVRHRGPAEPHPGHPSQPGHPGYPGQGHPGYPHRPARLDPRTGPVIHPATGHSGDLVTGRSGDPAAGRSGEQPGAGAVWLLPGERTFARRLRFLVTNTATLASLSLGVLAILLAMRGDVRTAAVCLVACVVLDGLDGMLARRLGVASPFGSQMDSLADMCAFGIAAPVVVYASIFSERSTGPGEVATGAGTGTGTGAEELLAGAGEAASVAAGSVPPAAAAVACALVAGCAAIRLARFNISPKDGRFFTGVPTTMAAAVLAVAVLIELPLSPAVQLGGVALLAFGMVSSFPYATLARLVRLPPWLWLVPLAGAVVDARLTFVALVLGYLASGPLLWLHQHRRAAAAA